MTLVTLVTPAAQSTQGRRGTTSSHTHCFLYLSPLLETKVAKRYGWRSLSAFSSGRYKRYKSYREGRL